jgi:hypothetical protein
MLDLGLSFGILLVFVALMLFCMAVYCIETGTDAVLRDGNVRIMDSIKALIGGPLLLLAFFLGFAAGPLGQWIAG